MQAKLGQRLGGVVLLGGLMVGAGCGGGSHGDDGPHSSSAASGTGPGAGGAAAGRGASGGDHAASGAGTTHDAGASGRGTSVGGSSGAGGASAGAGGAAGARGSTGGTMGGDSSAGQSGSTSNESGGAAGAAGDGGSAGFGVRFVGFIGDGPTDDLPAGTGFPTAYPDCSSEPSSIAPGLPRFNACFARGVVELMNSALAELIPDALTFHFESLELVVDPELAAFQYDGDGAGYDLQHLEGDTYRRPNTVTFVMPTTGEGALGAAFQDQRMNDDAGIAAVVVPAGGPAVFLHELGHAIGFPHTGTAADVPSFQYEGCGGVTIEPPVCSCEGANFMTVGTGTVLPAEGCDACTPAERSTFETPFFGPQLAAIAECWLTRRLMPPDITFLDGDCFAIVENAVSICQQTEEDLVTCQCPSGQIFGVSDCTDASQSDRDRAASAACDRISCTVPSERPGVVCESLAGWSNIECTCEDPSQKFYLGSDCSSLSLAAIQQFCPPL